MILCARNALCLALVVLGTAACGMMRDEGTTASTDKQNWFEYAYMSSAVNFETSEDGAPVAKPLRLQ